MNRTTAARPDPASEAVADHTVLQHELAPRVRRFDGAVVISQGDDALELDGVAADFYLALDGQSTVGDIATQVAQDYDADPEVVMTDATSLYQELVDAGVVAVVPPTRATEAARIPL